MSEPKANSHGLSVDTVYKELRAHASRMNDTLYRMPVLFAAVIGGLWFFAAQHIEKDHLISACVFFFAGICAATAALAMERYRQVFLATLHHVNEMEGRFAPAIPPTRVRTVTFFMGLLVVGGVLSMLGVAYALLGRGVNCFLV